MSRISEFMGNVNTAFIKLRLLFLTRMLRAGMATAVPVIWMQFSNDPWIILLTPFLMAVAKALRAHYPGNVWVKMIPF